MLSPTPSLPSLGTEHEANIKGPQTSLVTGHQVFLRIKLFRSLSSGTSQSPQPCFLCAAKHSSTQPATHQENPKCELALVAAAAYPSVAEGVPLISGPLHVLFPDLNPLSHSLRLTDSPHTSLPLGTPP